MISATLTGAKKFLNSKHSDSKLFSIRVEIKKSNEFFYLALCPNIICTKSLDTLTFTWIDIIGYTEKLFIMLYAVTVWKKSLLALSLYIIILLYSFLTKILVVTRVSQNFYSRLYIDSWTMLIYLFNSHFTYGLSRSSSLNKIYSWLNETFGLITFYALNIFVSPCFVSTFFLLVFAIIPWRGV